MAKITLAIYNERYRKVNEWIFAMERLLDHYTGKITIKSCPLCPVAGENQVFRGSPNCDTCVWIIETGKDCYRGYLGSSAIYTRKDKLYLLARIPQLKKWIVKYKRQRRYIKSKLGSK